MTKELLASVANHAVAALGAANLNMVIFAENRDGERFWSANGKLRNELVHTGKIEGRSWGMFEVNPKEISPSAVESTTATFAMTKALLTSVVDDAVRPLDIAKVSMMIVAENVVNGERFWSANGKLRNEFVHTGKIENRSWGMCEVKLLDRAIVSPNARSPTMMSTTTTKTMSTTTTKTMTARSLEAVKMEARLDDNPVRSVEPVKPTQNVNAMQLTPPIIPSTVGQPIGSTPFVDQPIQQMPFVSQQIQPTASFGQPIRPGLSVNQPIQPALSINQPIQPLIQPALSVNQPIQPLMSVNQPIQPTPSVGQPIQPIQPTPPIGQPIQPTPPVRQPPLPTPTLGQPPLPTPTLGEPPLPTPTLRQQTQPTPHIGRLFGKPVWSETCDGKNARLTKTWKPIRSMPSVSQPACSAPFVGQPVQPTPFVSQPDRLTPPVGQPVQPGMQNCNIISPPFKFLICQNCNKKGHNVSECRKLDESKELKGQKQTNERNKKEQNNLCRYCNHPGHVTQNCPAMLRKEEKEKAFESLCPVCVHQPAHRRGHDKKDCPVVKRKEEKKFARENRCTHCGLVGHGTEIEKCPILLDEPDRIVRHILKKKKRCVYCDDKTHQFPNCPSKPIGEYLFCDICEFVGHRQSVCPYRPGGRAIMGCGFCKAADHRLKKCRSKPPELVYCPFCCKLDHKAPACPLIVKKPGIAFSWKMVMRDDNY